MAKKSRPGEDKRRKSHKLPECELVIVRGPYSAAADEAFRKFLESLDEDGPEVREDQPGDRPAQRGRAMDPEFIDLEGAAKYLSLSQRTVREMASRGDIPVYAIGPNKGRLRFKVADLKEYVESCLRPAGDRVDEKSYRTTKMNHATRSDGKPFRHL